MAEKYRSGKSESIEGIRISVLGEKSGGKRGKMGKSGRRSRQQELESTGIEGLDVVLKGGVPRRRLFLVAGEPGAGKTTLGLQFLMEGLRQKESVLYVALSETREEILAIAKSRGWDLEGLHIVELTSLDPPLEMETHQTLFHAHEVELHETIHNLLKAIALLKPKRIVFDSLSELRMLSGNELRYRKQILFLKNHFVDMQCTVVLLDDQGRDEASLHIASIVHGIIKLTQNPRQFGPDHRRLRVIKMRGLDFFEGFHDYTIERGGLRVYPRLVVKPHPAPKRSHRPLGSGKKELDALWGGGLDEGGSVLILGPSGTGKSIVACHYLHSQASAGRKVSLFSFDETPTAILERCRKLGLRLDQFIRRGTLRMHPVIPTETVPGELKQQIRKDVETGSELVVLDSLSGYIHGLPEQMDALVYLQELIQFLRSRNTTALFVYCHSGLLGLRDAQILDLSYLADGIMLLRYYEFQGEIRKAISVFKRRGGNHERTIRELRIEQDGVHISEPLVEFWGVLSGTPELTGSTHQRHSKA